MYICKRGKCTGCFACSNVCPVNAVFMNEDERGHLIGEIDESKCINCKLCFKTCPENNAISLVRPKKAYAAWANEDRQRITSTSGGVASVLSQYIIDNNGVVYGSVFDKHKGVIHKRAETLEEIREFKGSKYTHSHINDNFKSVKKDLLNNRKVLFIGTPCQVSGLKNYLKHNYNNLYLVDIICHGVPSQKMLLEEISQYDPQHISFRDNDDYKLRLFDENGKILYEKSKEDSMYYLAFFYGCIFRDSCYVCKYATDKRVSDITIGDFWGLKSLMKNRIDYSKGISVILENNEKGGEMLKCISEKIIFEERPVQEAIDGNKQLQQPTCSSSEHEKFNNYYPNLDFKTSVKKAMRLRRLKLLIKKVIKFMKNI
ncbi:hypothetical protein A4S06_08435 [Erysipelotrichaceae bacterium MTC7]|nr:hypothetical protein A4S06_08435 [Erysipelotrichaceae bacterium MTC7]